MLKCARFEMSRQRVGAKESRVRYSGCSANKLHAPASKRLGLFFPDGICLSKRKKIFKLHLLNVDKFCYICLGAVRRHDEMKSYSEHLELRPGHAAAHVGQRWEHMKVRLISADNFLKYLKLCKRKKKQNTNSKSFIISYQIFLFTVDMPCLKNMLVFSVKITSLMKLSLA